MNNTIGVYIHFPFCRHKCFYCDFVSIAGREDLIDDYIDALVREIDEKADIVSDRRTTSIFFGGGTPSILYPEQTARLLDELGGRLKVMENAEITMEMNPESVTYENLRGYKEAGVNRVSIGVQSLDDEQLRFLERIHTADEARRAVADALKAGFVNVSADMIFGMPMQSMKSWMTQLRETMRWGIKHLSLYQLTPEPGTPLAAKVESGEVVLPEDPDALYGAAETLLDSFHFDHYEISNWARPGYECVHNVGYWENRDYLGLGAAAHGKIDGKRWSNERSVMEYIKRTLESGSAMAESEKLTPQLIAMERLMLGLRLRRGVQLEEGMMTPAIGNMITDGMLEIADGHLRATPAGFRLLDSVLEKI